MIASLSPPASRSNGKLFPPGLRPARLRRAPIEYQCGQRSALLPAVGESGSESSGHVQSSKKEAREFSDDEASEAARRRGCCVGPCIRSRTPIRRQRIPFRKRRSRTLAYGRSG